MISEIKDIEIYALLHKNVVIFIGRTHKELSKCISIHFNNCIREFDKYVQFYPKLYKHIKNNSNLKEYTYHSLGKYSKVESLCKSREAMDRFNTFEKCNSRKIFKDPDLMEIEKIKLEKFQYGRNGKTKRYLKGFYTCDQTGKRFKSISECAQYYGTTNSTISARCRKLRKNKRNKCKNKKLDGHTFTRTIK